MNLIRKTGYSEQILRFSVFLLEWSRKSHYNLSKLEFDQKKQVILIKGSDFPFFCADPDRIRKKFNLSKMLRIKCFLRKRFRIKGNLSTMHFFSADLICCVGLSKSVIGCSCDRLSPVIMFLQRASLGLIT